MDVYYSFDSLRKITNPVVTIGSYDGVHAGHKEIIRQINSVAKMINGESVIVTLFPHPREVLSGVPQKIINTLDEKIALLEQQGVDVLIVVPFTLEFGEIAPYEFVKKYLVDRIGVKRLVVGYDHRFGRGNEGDIEFLRSLQCEFNFRVIQIPQYSLESTLVSSTIVREAIMSGRMSDVNRYIGYQYSLTGEITPDGCVLINNKNKLIPPLGIYNVAVCCMGEYIETTLNISNNEELKVEIIGCKATRSVVIVNFI